MEFWKCFKGAGARCGPGDTLLGFGDLQLVNRRAARREKISSYVKWKGMILSAVSAMILNEGATVGHYSLHQLAEIFNAQRKLQTQCTTLLALI